MREAVVIPLGVLIYLGVGLLSIVLLGLIYTVAYWVARLLGRAK